MRPSSMMIKIAVILSLTLGLSGCFESSQERAERHFQNGLALIEAGDLPRAIVEFRNTLQLDEGKLDAYRQLATVNRKLGHLNEAYGSFLNLVERAPNDIEGRISLSELAFRAANWEEFERHANVAVKLDPNRLETQAIDIGLKYRSALQQEEIAQRAGLIVAAETLAKDIPSNIILRQIRLDSKISNGDYDSAIGLLDQSIAETPQAMELYTLRLELLSRLGRTADLEAELRNMLDVFEHEKGPKETYLSYLMSRDRASDAQKFLEELVASSTTEERNSAQVTLLQFIQRTSGSDVALAKVDELLQSGEEENGLLQTFRASLMFDMGRRDDGLMSLQSILASDDVVLNDSARQQAKTALARMLLLSGDEVQSRAQIDDVLKVNSRRADALLMRANWLIQDDETDAAIANLRTVLDDNPDDVTAMVLLARAFERDGNRDLMLSYLSQAVETSNNAPQYALRYARALVGDGKLLQAESTLISSLRIVERNFDVLSALGDLYLKMNDLPRAQQVADTVSKLNHPQANSVANSLKSEILARQVGPDQALEFLESVAARNGDLASKTALIQAQLQTGQVQEALSYAKAAVEEAPESPQLRAALAMTFAANRDFPAAAMEIEASLELAPSSPRLYLQLARIQGAQGNVAAGLASIERGLQAVPDAPDLLWAKASYLEGDGNIDGAIEIYEALYARNSSNLIVANNLASLLATYRDDDASLNRAKLIARRLRNGEVPAFQDTYGWVLYRTGELEDAVTFLEPAAAGLPKDARVQFHLAQAYASTGRTDQALVTMRKALDVLGPAGELLLRQKIETEIAHLSASLAED